MLIELSAELNPYCQKLCTAPQLIDEFKKMTGEIISQNKILIDELKKTKMVSLKSLGDRLKQKVRFFCDQNWMPQDEKDEMLSEFLTYDDGGGNGTVMYRVNTALNLPVYEGGPVCDIDLQAIVENHRKIKMNKI